MSEGRSIDFTGLEVIFRFSPDLFENEDRDSKFVPPHEGYVPHEGAWTTQYIIALVLPAIYLHPSGWPTLFSAPEGVSGRECPSGG
jgi:hypothetical protein